MMPNVLNKKQMTPIRKIIKQLEFSSTQNNFSTHTQQKYQRTNHHSNHTQDLQLKKKHQWIKPGYVNGQFSKTLAVRSRALDNWQIQRIPLATRSYNNPKDFRGIKSDFFSRQFPKDLSDNYSKKFQEHLKQLKKNYQNKFQKLTLQDHEKKRQKSIENIKGKGYRSQLSKDKLFGFASANHSKFAPKQEGLYIKQFNKTTGNYFKRND